MLDNSTIETLKAMHCSAMASELENQLNLNFQRKFSLEIEN